MRILVHCCLATMLLTGCGYPESHMGQVRFGDILVTARHSDGKLDFALACKYPGDVKLTITNDSTNGTRGKGITFCNMAQDRFWFDGEPVRVPKESKVFAVDSEGQVTPIVLTNSELATLAEAVTKKSSSDSLPDKTLEQKFSAAFKLDEVETRDDPK